MSENLRNEIAEILHGGRDGDNCNTCLQRAGLILALITERTKKAWDVTDQWHARAENLEIENRTLREQVERLRGTLADVQVRYEEVGTADTARAERAEARVAELEAHLEALIPLVPVSTRQNKGPQWMQTQAGKNAAVINSARRALKTERKHFKGNDCPCSVCQGDSWFPKGGK